MTVQVSPAPILESQGEGDRGNAYLRTLLQQCERQEIASHIEINGWLQELRQKAAYDVAQQRIPTRRDEEWRFTDVSGLFDCDFQLANFPQQEVAKAEIESFLLPEAQHSTAVFLNGVYAPELSNISALPESVFVGNLTQLSLENSYNAVNLLGKQEGEKEVFTALNTSGFADIAVVWVGANVAVETPIHLLFLTVAGDTPVFSLPRVLAVAETGSSVQIVEQYGAIAGTVPYFTNAVAEIWVQENAQVNHTRNQREAETGFHIGKTSISQARNSRYTCNALSFGGQLSRHNLNVWQTGEQTETTLNGLTAIAQQQTADTHSIIALNHPHGTTDQLHKCIVRDRAHSIFNGKVFVPKPAQLTNAAQLNRNLLLSPKARADTKPELQITADNVKCTHGATISQIEADELFYLQSRGINADSARNLLLDAFAAEILDRVPIPSLRQTLAQRVAAGQV